MFEIVRMFEGTEERKTQKFFHLKSIGWRSRKETHKFTQIDMNAVTQIAKMENQKGSKFLTVQTETERLRSPQN